MNTSTFEGVTIDPEGAIDLDDAIWIETDGQGWSLTVAIPQISSQFGPENDLEQQARERGYTRYANTGIKTPMLPNEITEALSLLPDGDRKVLVIRIPISRDFECGLPEISPGLFRSRARMTYAEASQAANDRRHPLQPVLAEAQRVAQGLANARRARGALSFYDLAHGLAAGEDGQIVRLDKEGGSAEMIVMEFMIAANASLAAYCADHGLPILYRNHRAKAVADRASLVEDAGLVEAGAISAELLSQRMALVLEKARLAPTVQGHWALNLPVYAWFTSPIRRYADLVNQRILEAHLDGRQSPYSDADLVATADHINSLSDLGKDTTAAWHKTRAERIAHAQITKGAVAAASPSQFKQIVKAAVANGGIQGDVAQEALRRLKAGALTSKDIYRLLMSGKAMAKAVVAHFAREPHVAVSVLMHGIQAAGWSDYRVSETSGGPSHTPTFKAKAHLKVNGSDFVSPWIEAKGRKAAQQLAVAHLLGQIAGLANDAPKAAAPASIRPAGHHNSDNPRGRLQEMCQKNRWPLPTFKIETIGPSHAPTFRGTGPSPHRFNRSHLGQLRRHNEERRGTLGFGEPTPTHSGTDPRQCRLDACSWLATRSGGAGQAAIDFCASAATCQVRHGFIRNVAVSGR